MPNCVAELAICLGGRWPVRRARRTTRSASDNNTWLLGSLGGGDRVDHGVRSLGALEHFVGLQPARRVVAVSANDDERGPGLRQRGRQRHVRPVHDGRVAERLDAQQLPPNSGKI
jgi:hypothetical protein